jgi:hypothetical protein
VSFVTILWRLAIATWFASVRLANFGAILVPLKFVTYPVMAFLIWRQRDSFKAALALLWPLAVLLIQYSLNKFGVVASAFARRNVLQAELSAVQNRPKEQLARMGTNRAAGKQPTDGSRK